MLRGTEKNPPYSSFAREGTKAPRTCARAKSVSGCRHEPRSWLNNQIQMLTRVRIFTRMSTRMSKFKCALVRCLHLFSSPALKASMSSPPWPYRAAGSNGWRRSKQKTKRYVCGSSARTRKYACMHGHGYKQSIHTCGKSSSGCTLRRGHLCRRLCTQEIFAHI